jgi:hypothetical protein
MNASNQLLRSYFAWSAVIVMILAAAAIVRGFIVDARARRAKKAVRAKRSRRRRGRRR